MADLPEVPIAGSERDTLAAFLDFYRAVLVRKVDDLDLAAATARPTASALTLLGIVKHMAYVERWWLQSVFTGAKLDYPWTEEDPDAELRIEPGDTVEGVLELYAEVCARSREIAAGADLDQGAVMSKQGRTLRWILFHLVEETARHAGHADIIRETLDGKTGD